MAYLTKEDLILKLTPYGYKSVASINRLIREQGLPAKYFTPRRVFFDEAEIEVWLSRRSFSVAKTNNDHIKVLRAQRRKRRESPETAAVAEIKAELKAFKKAEA
jgi:hypothetical protein